MLWWVNKDWRQKHFWVAINELLTRVQTFNDLVEFSIDRIQRVKILKQLLRKLSMQLRFDWQLENELN